MNSAEINGLLAVLPSQAERERWQRETADVKHQPTKQKRRLPAFGDRMPAVPEDIQAWVEAHPCLRVSPHDEAKNGPIDENVEPVDRAILRGDVREVARLLHERRAMGFVSEDDRQAWTRQRLLKSLEPLPNCLDDRAWTAAAWRQEVLVNIWLTERPGWVRDDWFKVIKSPNPRLFWALIDAAANCSNMAGISASGLIMALIQSPWDVAGSLLDHALRWDVVPTLIQHSPSKWVAWIASAVDSESSLLPSLLRLGADPEQPLNDLRPVYRAILKDKAETFEVLIKAGVDRSSCAGESMLSAIVLAGAVEVLERACQLALFHQDEEMRVLQHWEKFPQRPTKCLTWDQWMCSETSARRETRAICLRRLEQRRLRDHMTVCPPTIKMDAKARL